MAKLNTNNILKLSLKDIENMEEPLGDEDFLKITKEDFKKLNPETKELFIREEIRYAVRKYGHEGLSIDELVELSEHDKKTILKHLEALIGLREVYSQKKNKKLILYYPNGIPLHSINRKIVDMGNTYFEISVAIGPKEKSFFHILEKRASLLDDDKAEGAILVPLDKFDEFIKSLEELREEFGGFINE